MESVRSRPVVLVDANALLLPFTAHFRLEEEIFAQVDGARIVVPTSVLGELEQVAARGTPNARAAREWAQRFERVETYLTGDDALVDLGRRMHAWVVTGDRALRARLLEAGVRVLFPRGKSHLDRAVSPRKTAPAPRRRRPRSR